MLGRIQASLRPYRPALDQLRPQGAWVATHRLRPFILQLTQESDLEPSRRSFSTKIIVFPPKTSIHTRGLADKVGKGGKKKNKNLVDKLVEDLVDDDDDDEQETVDIQNSPLNKFLSSKGGSAGHAKKGSKGNLVKMKYSEFTEIVKGERLWAEMNKTVENLKTFYIQQLSVRSSTSLDDLPIELEGDMYPLNELAAISKKDPKRLIIDASAFPQATKNIMLAIKNSGMNLNPQQDGFFIFVPIPKVTTEHREQLAEGARKRCVEGRAELRRQQNSALRKVGEMELADKISKEDSKAAQDTIKLIAEHFGTVADQLLAAKTKELLGK